MSVPVGQLIVEVQEPGGLVSTHQAPVTQGVTLHGLKTGVQYKFRSRVVNPVGTSVWSDWKPFTPTHSAIHVSEPPSYGPIQPPPTGITFHMTERGDPEEPEVECCRCNAVTPLKTSSWEEHDPRAIGWWCKGCRVDIGMDVEYHMTIPRGHGKTNLLQTYQVMMRQGLGVSREEMMRRLGLSEVER